MTHYGDITKLSGWTLPIVDVITGGSPCQDLSVAGKREGLAGERSGLFMEQVRITKEMRERDRTENGRSGFLVRPRYMVWENVPGAFSSNGGKDFQAVLSEIIRIADTEAPDVPMPEKGGWSKSGCLYSDLGEWSVAWRVHDAQFWGVPQRRKRIALVADFGGLSAPEILFIRKGMSGHSEPGETAREETARSVGNGIKSAVDLYNGCITGNTAVTFGASSGMSANHTGPCVMETHLADGESADQEEPIPINKIVCIEGNGQRESHLGDGWKESETMYTLNTVEQHAVLAFTQNQRDEVRDLGDKAGSLAAEPGMKQQTFLCLNDQGGQTMDLSEDITGTLRAQDHGHPPICLCFEPRSPDGVPRIIREGIAPTLNTAQGGQRQPCVTICYEDIQPG